MDLSVKIHNFFSHSGFVGGVLAAAALALAACSGGYGGSGSAANCASGYGGGGNGNGAGCVGNPVPHPSPSPVAALVAVRLQGETASTDPTFGTVIGYQLGTTGNTAQVIHLTANTSVQFTNIDTEAHTATFLGMWAGSYPASIPASSLGASASPAGTSLSTANFSSGNLNPGASSLVYSSGGAGMLVFGCFYHYVSNNMRTVVVVM
jgi:plastocyanin